MIRLILVFIILLAFELVCQTDSMSLKVGIRLHTDEGTPIEEISKYVPIYPDKIYLFADFDYVASINKNNGTKDPKYIPIYIINNTEEEYSFTGLEMQTLQQVYRVNDSSWIRTQPRIPAWCGNSYDWVVEIGPKEFYKVLKYLPDDGEKQIIRYTFFNSEVVSSNAGFGMVDIDEAEKAKYDLLALRICSSDFLIDIINSKIEPFETESENEKFVKRAMDMLTWRLPEKAIPILEKIANNNESPFQENAKYNLKIIDEWKKQYNK